MDMEYDGCVATIESSHLQSMVHFIITHCVRHSVYKRLEKYPMDGHENMPSFQKYWGITEECPRHL